MIYVKWVGTDALKLIKYPPGKFNWKIRIFFERIFWRVFEPLVDEHFVVHPSLAKHLINFGISEKKISIKMDLGLCQYCMKPCEKLEHDGIYIAYYYPGDRGNRKFKRWVYGMDIIDQIIMMYPQIHWVHLDGKQNICNIYPVIDGYIRPSRHDGLPRIILECLALDIPYYWDDNFNPTIGKVKEYVDKIIDSNN